MRNLDDCFAIVGENLAVLHFDTSAIHTELPLIGGSCVYTPDKTQSEQKIVDSDQFFGMLQIKYQIEEAMAYI